MDTWMDSIVGPVNKKMDDVHRVTVRVRGETKSKMGRVVTEVRYDGQKAYLMESVEQAPPMSSTVMSQVTGGAMSTAASSIGELTDDELVAELIRRQHLRNVPLTYVAQVRGSGLASASIISTLTNEQERMMVSTMIKFQLQQFISLLTAFFCSNKKRKVHFATGGSQRWWLGQEAALVSWKDLLKKRICFAMRTSQRWWQRWLPGREATLMWNNQPKKVTVFLRQFFVAQLEKIAVTTRVILLCVCRATPRMKKKMGVGQGRGGNAKQTHAAVVRKIRPWIFLSIRPITNPCI
jgi:hypothetical protein